MSIISVLAAVAVSVGGDGSKPAALKAQDVLDRMAAAYAGCKSYIDSGVVRRCSTRRTASSGRPR